MKQIVDPNFNIKTCSHGQIIGGMYEQEMPIILTMAAFDSIDTARFLLLTNSFAKGNGLTTYRGKKIMQCVENPSYKVFLFEDCFEFACWLAEATA